MYDPIQSLTEYADHLNTINKAHWFPRVFYEVMSGGLVWSDETNAETPTEVIWALRFLVAYRTGLMLNQPKPKFQVYWDHGLSMFPRWIGFRPNRWTPTNKLLNIYRRGDVSTRKCLRDLEREMDADANNDA